MAEGGGARPSTPAAEAGPGGRRVGWGRGRRYKVHKPVPSTPPRPGNRGCGGFRIRDPRGTSQAQDSEGDLQAERLESGAAGALLPQPIAHLAGAPPTHPESWISPLCQPAWKEGVQPPNPRQGLTCGPHTFFFFSFRACSQLGEDPSDLRGRGPVWEMNSRDRDGVSPAERGHYGRLTITMVSVSLCCEAGLPP